MVCATAGALGFAFKAIFVKAAYAYGVDAETLLCLRMAYSLPLFALMAWNVQRRDPYTLTATDWRDLALLGVLGYYLSSYLDFLGLRYISAALERIVLFIYPTLVALLSAAFLGKPLTRRSSLLLVLSYVGVALSVVPDLRAGSGHTLLGVGLVLGSALSFALYLLKSGATVHRVGSTRVTAYATGIACVLCVAQFLLLRPARAVVQPWQVHALAACMAVFSTVLPIWLLTEAIRRLGASTTAMFGSLGPVLTLLLASALLHEPLSWVQLAGAMIVMLSIARLTRVATAQPRQAQSPQRASH